MRIAVVGGGPAGVYFAILAAKAWPELEIDVFERNRADDTFGFGVVFSDETLDTFEKCDRESYQAIADNFAYWDDIEIHFKGGCTASAATAFAAARGPTLCNSCTTAPARSA
jgi:anthraniloyl-CoA monooxygenase